MTVLTKANIMCCVAQTMNVFGINKIMRHVCGGQGVILMFHSLCRDTGQRINEGGVLHSDFFETLLQRITALKLRPLRLCDVPQYLQQPPSERFVCLTFDDGYKDNLSLMAPLAQKYQVPVTIFVTSGALQGALYYEWGGLEEYIRHHKHIAIGNFKSDLLTIAQKRAAYRAITRHYLSAYDIWQPLLQQFLKEHDIDLSALASQHFMSASEIELISRYSMIDIGGHTWNHPMLSQLPAAAAFAEIKRNRDDLTTLLGRDIDCFAYPFGGVQACGDREFALVQKAGYKIAVTTRTGMVFAHDKERLHSVPRITVSGLYEHPAMIDLYLSGGWSLLRKFLAPRAAS